MTKNILYLNEQRLILNTLQERWYILQSLLNKNDSVPLSTLSRGLSSSSKRGPRYGTFNENASLLRTDGGEETDEESETSGGRDDDGHELQQFDEEKGDRQIVPSKPHFMSSLIGMIPEDKILAFKRMIFRISRGNVLVKLTPLPEPMPDPLRVGEFVKKYIFRLTFLGDQLEKRLKRVIAFFGAVEYEFPVDTQQRMKIFVTTAGQIKDAQQLLSITYHQISHNLKSLAWDATTGSSPYIDYMYALRVEKGISDTLKKCDIERAGSTFLRMEAWIPEDDASALQSHVRQAVVASGMQPAACQIFSDREAQAQLHNSPPTFFKTNKFTEPYQGIVDTYGVARYKEVNPGLFTIISFPFLFGVMYGDIGHGTLLTLGALWFIWNERYYQKLIRYGEMDEIMGMVFGGRYMLILMGLFAVYAGFIYNDCFSIPFNIFGSRWYFPADSNQPAVNDGVYPFGVDPSWYHTTNELAFFNSLKMKLAVTLGVVQMTFGIVLGAFNNSYFGNRKGIFFEFLPRLTFLLSTFGYMIFLIIYKFCVDWTTSPVAPPNLVQTMIAMFLSPGQVDPDKQLYAGQAVIQTLLLVLAIGSVPVMLLAQPLTARAQHNAIFGKKNSRTHYVNIDRAHTHTSYHTALHDDDEQVLPLDDSAEKSGTHVGTGGGTSGGGSGSHGSEGSDPLSPNFDFNTLLIEQGIHTIEFVLGAVSNTASYLRLWALSLAHAELSDVFWKKMISQYGLETSSPIR